MRGRLTAITLIVALWLSASTLVFGEVPTEDQVKAVFLFNFTKFVDWPASAVRSGSGVINICLIGEDVLGRSLDEIVRGQNVGGRALAVRRLAQIPRDDSCQVAFLGGLEKSRVEQILAPVKNLPVLTVIDRDEGGESGSMIGFVIEDRKVRFNINLDTAERAGLKISSKLLKLAKTVRDKGGK